MKWGSFFEVGGAMTFSPQTIKELSLWEFHMTLNGFNKSKSSPGEAANAVKPPSEEEFFAILEATKQS